MDPSSLFTDLAAAPRQEILIRTHGEDVPRFDTNGEADLDVVVADPVAAFARAVTLGMFGEARAELAGQRVEALEQSWWLRVEDVDAGALRVLANMLLGRELSSVEMSTASVDGAHPVEKIDPARAPYRAPASLPFTLEREPPERPSRDRFVQIVFATPPAASLIEEVYGAFDAWDALLLLGGYPAPRRTPRASGAMPDPAFLLDACTVEQAFPDLFLCDEAGFVPLVEWAVRLHRTGALIDRVVVG